MKDLQYHGPYSWSLDLSRPIGSLISEMKYAIESIASPFFERFNSIECARDAIASDDPWCFGGPIFWRQLLFLDAAMNDIAHFKAWAIGLEEFALRQANEALDELAQVGIR